MGSNIRLYNLPKKNSKLAQKAPKIDRTLNPIEVLPNRSSFGGLDAYTRPASFGPLRFDFAVSMQPSAASALIPASHARRAPFASVRST
ncbi:MAG: hypothetical protein ABSA17_08665 [Rhabdochlamydiaceae bacterium]